MSSWPVGRYGDAGEVLAKALRNTESAAIQVAGSHVWRRPCGPGPRGNGAASAREPTGRHRPSRVRSATGSSQENVAITETTFTVLSPDEIDRLAQKHLDDRATAEEIALLESDRDAWIASLWRLLDEAEAALRRAQHNVRGHERAAVLADLDNECYRIDDVLNILEGPLPDPEPEPVLVETTQLQLSWTQGRLVAWAAGFGCEPEDEDSIRKRLEQNDGGAIAWESHEPVKIPGVGSAPAVSAPIGETLGWVVALGAARSIETLGVSVVWMGLAAAAAVELVAHGSVVPQVEQIKNKEPAENKDDRGDQGDKRGIFQVTWAPALVDASTVDGLVESIPGAVRVCNRGQQVKKFVSLVLADFTSAIVHAAAAQIEVPAAPPEARTRADVGETMLCRLDGTEFSAPPTFGGELSRKLTQWARPIVGTPPVSLVVTLDEPDDVGAWHAAVLSPNSDGNLEPVEVTMTTASDSVAKAVGRQLSRLERLFPELLRPGGRRRGEVILSQDEAWRLMTESGETLVAAGFELRVPPLSRKKPTASLRLTAGEADETVVGAQQLANVHWSAVFDDIELTQEEISRLAAEARPLVQTRGRWVELDKADLVEAAAALADRADQTRMTGADMLRHALGLEGSPLAGGISLAGEGWAADLLESLDELPEHPETSPDGFRGELRSYQADALAWLDFLDSAGLGGCLALDMGLGKTPVSLANLALGTTQGPGLVIAPPAVVGNWAAEAERFVPDAKVLVHHGPNRTKGIALSRRANDADIVITTYGTAVRDIDELEEIEWGKVVLDEAQAIKNPAAETSQQLRRLQAQTRLALTGTPIENGLGDLWAILDWANPGLLGPRASFIAQLTPDSKSTTGGEEALRALNGILVYRRTKAEPAIAEELPDRIDELDHCAMTPEQIGLYQAVIDGLVAKSDDAVGSTAQRKGAVLAAITALKQICNHPVNYDDDGGRLDGRSGKLDRLNEIVDAVFAADERVLIFTHFATWGERLAAYMTERTGRQIDCYHGGLARGARDRMVERFQASTEAGAMVLSLKAGGTGLNLTAANHVVLYDRWWNPAVEDQARDRVWRIGQTSTVICHRLVCPGTVDERVEEVVEGKRQIANLVLPKSSSIGDLDADQLQQVLGIDQAALLSAEDETDVAAGPEVDDG